MKKWWKRLLGAFLIALLAVGGYIVYELNFKTYETADKEVEEITASEYEIDLPDTTVPAEGSNDKGKPGRSVITSNTDNSESSDSATLMEMGQSGNESRNKEPLKQNIAETTSKGETEEITSTTPESKRGTRHSSNSVPTPSVTSIKSKYEPVFESLEAQANSKINHLAAKAFNEYIDKKQNKEQVSYGYFYNKYTSAADTLESNTDSAFNMVYSALQEDLKKNGYSPSHASTFKDQYEKTKTERKNALLKKATSAL